MPSASNDTIAAAIALALIATVGWLVRFLVTTGAKREAAMGETLQKFSTVVSANTAVMHSLSGAFDRLTAEVREIREDLDRLSSVPQPIDDDETPVARPPPKLVTVRPPRRGQKDES